MNNDGEHQHQLYIQICIYIHTHIPLQDDFLSSFSTSILSRRLSSTAKTWGSSPESTISFDKEDPHPFIYSHSVLIRININVNRRHMNESRAKGELAIYSARPEGWIINDICRRRNKGRRRTAGHFPGQGSTNKYTERRLYRRQQHQRKSQIFRDPLRGSLWFGFSPFNSDFTESWDISSILFCKIPTPTTSPSWTT